MSDPVESLRSLQARVQSKRLAQQLASGSLLTRFFAFLFDGSCPGSQTDGGGGRRADVVAPALLLCTLGLRSPLRDADVALLYCTCHCSCAMGLKVVQVRPLPKIQPEGVVRVHADGGEEILVRGDALGIRDHAAVDGEEDARSVVISGRVVDATAYCVAWSVSAPKGALHHAAVVEEAAVVAVIAVGVVVPPRHPTHRPRMWPELRRAQPNRYAGQRSQAAGLSATTLIPS
eukprot:scaffold358_cov256-Pinguiococcus_pyrenoidosus.AAC.33